MMKLAVLATLAGFTAAFTPSPVAHTASTALNADLSTEVEVEVEAQAQAPDPAPAAQTSSTVLTADFSNELGAQVPLGFFDPLGLLENADQEEFERLRWVELKHGRVSMLAVVGYLVTYAGVRFPGAGDIPSGFAALDNLPGMVWAQMFATWAMMEAANQDQYVAPWGTNQNALGDSPAEFKGDFRNGFIDFGWDKLSDDAKMRKRAIELNQGRAAQMGILGLMVHDKLGNIDKILPL